MSPSSFSLSGVAVCLFVALIPVMTRSQILVFTPHQSEQHASPQSDNGKDARSWIRQPKDKELSNDWSVLKNPNITPVSAAKTAQAIDMLKTDSVLGISKDTAKALADVKEIPAGDKDSFFLVRSLAFNDALSTRHIIQRDKDGNLWITSMRLGTTFPSLVKKPMISVARNAPKKVFVTAEVAQ